MATKKIKITKRHVVVGGLLAPQPLARLKNRLAARNAEFHKAGPIVWRKASEIKPDEFETGPLGESMFASHPTLRLIESQLGLNNVAAGKGKGKGTGKGTGKGKPRPKPKWPNPDMVHKEVVRMYHGKPKAGNTGNVVVMELNCEFGNLSKFQYFEKAFTEVFGHGHIVFLSEVDSAGVNWIASQIGYHGTCSPANSRGQAVGFVVHPRLKLIGGPTEYKSLQNIQGIPDLRPGWRIDLEDTVSGLKFSTIVLHLKSMLGGPKVTSVIRYQQCQALVNDIAPDLAKIDNGDKDAVAFLVGGDMNFRLNTKFNDADALYNAGFQLVARWDQRGTQVMNNSRIDGVWHKGLKFGVDWYDVTPFFMNKKLGRSFTDHGQTEFQILTATKDNTSAKDDTATTDASTDDTAAA